VIASQVQALMYYLLREYTVSELDDQRFIQGRAARILWKGVQIGVFGEVHPQVLENWGITTPCIACELDIEALLT
jgi:phenylalanyl-tRNA synthetase beta chain